MKKPIKINEETRDQLMHLKYLKKFKSVDATIKYLLDAEHVCEWIDD